MAIFRQGHALKRAFCVHKYANGFFKAAVKQYPSTIDIVDVTVLLTFLGLPGGNNVFI